MASGASAAQTTQPVSWTVGDTTFDGVMVYDDANATPRPGLLMVPNWYGINDSAIEKAKSGQTKKRKTSAQPTSRTLRQIIRN
jgi:dienelactone hydrolase